VWEWGLNEYEHPERAQLSGSQMRALRGGSWIYLPLNARAAYRSGYHPDYRSNDIGFRVVCAPVPRPSGI
jgi:formylglycine-generating enzyme required for sulfatase activity